MLDTVTFDLWNTLLSNKPQDYQRYRFRRIENLGRVLKQNGKEVGSQHLLDAYLKGFEKCKETWRKNQDLSTREQLQTMFRFVEEEELRDMSYNLMPELMEAYVSPILEDPPEVIDGAQKVLSQTKAKGYRVGLICNTGTTPGSTIVVLLERLGMMRYFDVASFSNELKIRKPDPRIFLHTLSQLKSQPQNSVHVGDLIDADVWGARNVGMISVHFNQELTPCDDAGPDFAITRLEELSWILPDLKSAQNN
jgi:putative hydrolase of the HAD superfamily